MTTTPRPLGKIALALSGGGYRAAAFHLGTMQALDDLGLLADVRLLSTASGGSIVGARYVLSIAAGHDFSQFAAELTKLLRTNVVADALDRLHEGARTPSLIQRAAEVYDGHFLGKRLGELADDEVIQERLERVIINASHFSLGYAFRFQFPPRKGSPFGNRAVKMPKGAWKQIRLADAVAASSCFPAGFEPLCFPQDFDWGPSGSAQPPEVSARPVGGSGRVERCLPLMDGGIYDNQAIEALLLESASASTPEEGVGLLFTSDTDQRHTPYYEPPRQGRVLQVLGGLPLWFVLLKALVLTCLPAALAWSVHGPLATLAHVVATLGGACVLAVLALLALAQASLPFPYPRLAGQLLRTTLRDLFAIAASRVTSVLALTAKVFMYRVRDLGYEIAYDELPGRVIASQIYAASEDGLGPLQPSDGVRARARQARAVATSLWMTDAEREVVVATGYATAVASLVRYLRRWQQRGEAMRPGPFPVALLTSAEAAWTRVNAD